MDNGNEIDAGYVGVKDTTEPSTTYTVVFKDYDGSVLKTETVAAVNPQPPLLLLTEKAMFSLNGIRHSQM